MTRNRVHALHASVTATTSIMSRILRKYPLPKIPLQVIMTIPEKLAVTSVDAEGHDVVGPLAAECSELTALTLWLVAERARGAASAYTGLLGTLPVGLGTRGSGL